MAYRIRHPFMDIGSGITPQAGAKLTIHDVGTSNLKATYSDFALSVANTNPVIADASGVFGDIFADVSADLTLTDADDVLIWGPDTVYPPDDTLSNVAASVVALLDAAGNYTAADVEAAFLEVSDNYLKKSRADTITAAMTFGSGGSLQLADNLIVRPEIKDYNLTWALVVQTTATPDFDVEDGNAFSITLTENATFSLSNPIAGKFVQITIRIIQDGAGGAYTVTWPASVLWPSGSAPTISTGNSAVDQVTLWTMDQGATWYGNYAQAFA